MKKMPIGMRLKYAFEILAGRYHQTNVFMSGMEHRPRRIELTSRDYITRRTGR